jgi:diguanylate cyclase (GGDEF)-like protein
MPASTERPTAILRSPLSLAGRQARAARVRAASRQAPIVGRLADLFGGDVRASLPILRPVAEALECGLLLVVGGQTLVANQALATMVGLTPRGLLQMGPTGFARHLATLVDDPPALLRDLCLLPLDGDVLCEEFEISRPSRSVVRWVARRLSLPGADGFLATCTDITTEVDLSAAQERLALTDSLSGMVNRRGMQDALTREIARARRSGSTTSVILIDIDHFKAINDQHGHGIGDDVLRNVARRIAGAVRASDTIARWGGEEFLVLLPDTPLHGARVCAEHIRRAVEASEGPLKVTVSLGAAELSAGESPHLAIGRADLRLYEAKAAGRNRVA